jgi:hypothetical protein
LILSLIVSETKNGHSTLPKAIVTSLQIRNPSLPVRARFASHDAFSAPLVSCIQPQLQVTVLSPSYSV